MQCLPARRTGAGGPTCASSATGTRTRFGRTAALVAGEAPPARSQCASSRIGRYLLVLSVVLVAAILAISLLRGNTVTTTLELALVVRIASIPGRCRRCCR